MIKVSQEEFIKRYEALSDSLREKFLSEENINMLWLIGEAHHLSEERIQKIAGVVGYVTLGLVHLEDVGKEIRVEAGVDRRLADEIAREIQLKILNPVMPELNRLYGYGGVAETPSMSPPPQPTIMRPAFAPPPQETREGRQETKEFVSGQPFILHEEKGGIEPARPREEGELMRPSFYEETRLRQDYGGQAESEPPTAARLEIGGAEEKSQEGPRVGRTEAPPVRVVHYSGPQTPVDPFGSQTPDISNQSSEADKRNTESSKDIHPENIVDLKDLPK